MSESITPGIFTVHDLRTRLDAVEAENEILREIVVDLHWMARRYADNRSSYAPGMLNRHVRTLRRLGVVLNECDGSPFARDAMGRSYDGLTNAELAEFANTDAREEARRTDQEVKP